MNAETLINEIALLAMSPSPFTEEAEDPGFYDQRRIQWYWQHKELLEQGIVDLFINPPEAAAYAPVTKENFELELLDLLALIEDQESKTILLKKLGAGLGTAVNKSILLEAIAVLGLSEAWDYLAGLSYARFTLEEKVSFVNALGSIRHPNAHKLLLRLKRSELGLQQEIDLALEKYS